ncbi:MAG: hypothetical protein VXW43_10660, partial [Pseudomonadota bacterium]|nr:hypothetical protein [Pseudomonadota bacterium]
MTAFTTFLRRTTLGTVMGTAIATAIAAPGLAEDLPRLKAALYMSGTVAWEVDTIQHNGFDRDAGFQMEVMDIAGGAAGRVAGPPRPSCRSPMGGPPQAGGRGRRTLNKAPQIK